MAWFETLLRDFAADEGDGIAKQKAEDWLDVLEEIATAEPQGSEEQQAATLLEHKLRAAIVAIWQPTCDVCGKPLDATTGLCLDDECPSNHGVDEGGLPVPNDIAAEIERRAGSMQEPPGEEHSGPDERDQT
jgi:hypothetical protein